nr:hypothetical protein [Kitasatospora sp. MY 5-36]
MTLTTTTDHRPLLDPEAAPEGRDDGRAGRLRHRAALALAVLVQPLAGLGLLDRYRAAVLEKIPDAAPGAVKAGVWAGWLFGSVLGAIGVLLAVLLAGAAGAAACRLAGARWEAPDRIRQRLAALSPPNCARAAPRSPPTGSRPPRHPPSPCATTLSTTANIHADLTKPAARAAFDAIVWILDSTDHTVLGHPVCRTQRPWRQRRQLPAYQLPRPEEPTAPGRCGPVTTMRPPADTTTERADTRFPKCPLSQPTSQSGRQNLNPRPIDPQPVIAIAARQTVDSPRCSFTERHLRDGGDGGQKRVSEQGKGDMPVPAHVAAHFVLVQAAFVPGALEDLLDLPAAARDADQVRDGGLQRRAGGRRPSRRGTRPWAAPADRRCQASGGACPMRWSMRGPWTCWDLGTATTQESWASSRKRRKWEF